MKPNVISIVLNAHVPFVREPKAVDAVEEHRFFESLSETYLPLLEMFDRLDADHVPFRVALSLSPILCHLCKDELLLERYLDYTDRQIEFGAGEIERTKGDEVLQCLAKRFYDTALERRSNFVERYEKNILGVFDHYQRKGRLELLNTAATHAFLPFYTSWSEVIQAQFEVAASSYRRCFGSREIQRTDAHSQGFWLPELGWTPELERFFRAYNFGYTIVDTHAFALATPPATYGSFYPARTPRGLLLLARDYYAYKDIVDNDHGFLHNAVYRDNYEDVGYELPVDMIRPFTGADQARIATGYKYRALGSASRKGGKPLYDPGKAAQKAREQAITFLDRRIMQFNRAAQFMDQTRVSLCAYNADTFGRFWHEGIWFLEALFREGAKCETIQFMTPSEYLFKQNTLEFEVIMPSLSSEGVNGYAETWLDSSNDWMYRHVARAIERMIELADRFPNENSIKERLLNQAVREILLAQTSDWAKMLYKKESTAYACAEIEMSLRNFTTIYEALASNYISTEWFTALERRHNIFPHINYRVFRHALPQRDALVEASLHQSLHRA
jgi:1,4-alpha-glucan branching enzyme